MQVWKLRLKSIRERGQGHITTKILKENVDLLRAPEVFARTQSCVFVFTSKFYYDYAYFIDIIYLSHHSHGIGCDL